MNNARPNTVGDEAIEARLLEYDANVAKRLSLGDKLRIYIHAAYSTIHSLQEVAMKPVPFKLLIQSMPFMCTKALNIGSPALSQPSISRAVNSCDPL